MASNAKHLFIVTYGRTGSTLLQGVLNDSKNCLMKGENNNILYDFFKAYRKIVAMKKRWTGEDASPAHPWYGCSDYDEMKIVDFLRNEFFEMAGYPDLKSTQVVGFKEIRYLEIGGDLEVFLDFISLVFEDTFFVFNIRNFDDVSNSGWWKNEDKESLRNKLAKFESRVLRYCSKHTKNTFTHNYEDILGEKQDLRKLFEKLGWEFKLEEVNATLGQNHSIDNRSRGDCGEQNVKKQIAA